MPLDRKTTRYLERARHNYEHYQRLRSRPEDHDWALIALFYCAVRLLQAYAWEYGPNPFPHNHLTRKQYIDSYVAVIADWYKELYTGSQSARYRLYHPTLEELDDYHDSYFTPILAKMKTDGIMW